MDYVRVTLFQYNRLAPLLLDRDKRMETFYVTVTQEGHSVKAFIYKTPSVFEGVLFKWICKKTQ